MEHCYKTFVSVGNAKQPFSRLLNSIELLDDILPQPILVQSGHTPFDSSGCDVIDFISMDEFSNYINHAEILILHAGAGSVLHAIKANKKPILVPRKAQFNEHVNDHQVAFANMLHTEGRVIMVENTEELRSAIRKIQSSDYSYSMDDNKSRACEMINSLLIKLLNKPGEVSR